MTGRVQYDKIVASHPPGGHSCRIGPAPGEVMITRMADLTPAARLEGARQQVGTAIFRGARSVSPLAQWTGYVDSEMRRLAAAAGPPGRAALIAVGGYGR